MRIRLLFLFISLSALLSAQSWTQKADFGGGLRGEACGFSIGTKGYFTCGYSDTIIFRDLWEYDPVADSWTQMADYGGNPRTGAVAFSIGSYGYVGLGRDTIQYSDFWKYDPFSNAWYPVASFTGSPRSSAVALNCGNKGYVATGYDYDIDSLFNDLREYDPSGDAWLQLSNLPGPQRMGACGFSIGQDLYIGTGWTQSPAPYLNDFWRYDTLSDSWTAIAPFTGPDRFGASGFAVDGNGYVSSGGMIHWPYTNYTDLWKYDPVLNSWSALAGYSSPSYGKRYCASFVIGSSLYIGGGTRSGFDPAAIAFSDFWKYTLNDAASIGEISSTGFRIFPDPCTDHATLVFDHELSQAELSLYDPAGKKIRSLVSLHGRSVNFDRNGLPAGNYLIRISGKGLCSASRVLAIVD